MKGEKTGTEGKNDQDAQKKTKKIFNWRKGRHQEVL